MEVNKSFQMCFNIQSKRNECSVIYCSSRRNKWFIVLVLVLFVLTKQFTSFVCEHELQSEINIASYLVDLVF